MTTAMTIVVPAVIIVSATAIIVFPFVFVASICPATAPVVKIGTAISAAITTTIISYYHLVVSEPVRRILNTVVIKMAPWIASVDDHAGAVAQEGFPDRSANSTRAAADHGNASVKFAHGDNPLVRRREYSPQWRAVESGVTVE